MGRGNVMKVLTIGTFDLVHWGHVDFLKQCSRLGEVMVGVNSDAFVGSFKQRPVMNALERMYAISGLGYETVLNESSGRELIEELIPDILAVGSDWARKDYLKQIDVTQDWLDERNIMLAYIPYVQNMPISSTEVKRRVHEQYIISRRTTLAS
jgi:cytidyltransferase-like protein